MIQETAPQAAAIPESHIHESPPGLVDPDEGYRDEHTPTMMQSQ